MEASRGVEAKARRAAPLPSRSGIRGRKKSNAAEKAQHFRVVAWWASDHTGIAKSSSAPNAIHFTSPPAFGGLEGRWTPEELLFAAIASSFTTTFRALAEFFRFEYTDLQVEVEGFISRGEMEYHFDNTIMRVNLAITREEKQAAGKKLIHKAKKLCPVMRALSAKQTFKAIVTVGTVPP